MKRFEIQSGNEIRGMMIRLYPDKETEEKLRTLKSEARYVWNWLVKQIEEVLDARQAYALAKGLVSTKPQPPDYVGLTPEASKAKKEQYIQQIREWHSEVHKVTNKLPECAYRSLKELQTHFGCKYDYNLLQRVESWHHEGDVNDRAIKGGAHFYQALIKNYSTRGSNQRRKKFRRSFDSMPLQVRSGDCFELGDFGSRGVTHKKDGEPTCYYNCRIKFNGLKIKGRLPGKSPKGRVLEGISITHKADGWWASIKVEVPIRQLSPTIPGSVIGIDVGLDNIAAMSDGSIINNTRGKEYAERIAGRQIMASERRAKNLPTDKMEAATRRLQLASSRHTDHEISNKITKHLATIETIKIERLQPDIGQRGSPKISVMRRIHSKLLERYGARDDKGQPVLGNRVREVEPHYTSQDCSQCGFRSKESWSYDHGPIGECPNCNYRAHRDVNAARNIAAKPAISLNV